MPLTEADLMRKFLDDVRWFNNNNFKTGPANQYERFHNDIKMKKIDDPGVYADTKADVANYFNTTGTTDKAQFVPDQGPSIAHRPNSNQPNCKVAGAMGFVSGTADFVYSTASAARQEVRRIAYSFTYVDVAGEFKAIHLWGTYIG